MEQAQLYLKTEEISSELKKAERLRFENRCEEAIAMVEAVYPKASPMDRLPARELHSACLLDLGRCIEGLKLLDPKIFSSP